MRKELSQCNTVTEIKMWLYFQRQMESADLRHHYALKRMEEVALQRGFRLAQEMAAKWLEDCCEPKGLAQGIRALTMPEEA